MCVCVLAGNPARDFYERLGGIELSSRNIEVCGRRLEEVCYLWLDLYCFEALEEHYSIIHSLPKRWWCYFVY